VPFLLAAIVAGRLASVALIKFAAASDIVLSTCALETELLAVVGACLAMCVNHGLRAVPPVLALLHVQVVPVIDFAGFVALLGAGAS
jgi:hypothetical protein